MGFLIGLATKAVPWMPSWAWRWVGLGLLAAASCAFGAWKMHEHDSARYEALEGQFETFKAQAAALGKAAQAAADRQKAADEKRKEDADAQNKTARDRLAADNQRLRNELANRDPVPPVPAGSRRPDLACFDRAELGAAIRDFREEVRGQVGEGAAATVDLDSAKLWAQKEK